MKKLKTLKDIELEKITQFPNDVRKELRQEAIKWIKFIQENQKKLIFIDKLNIIWIKHFFNITEEELK